MALQFILLIGEYPQDLFSLQTKLEEGIFFLQRLTLGVHTKSKTGPLVICLMTVEIQSEAMGLFWKTAGSRGTFVSNEPFFN